MGVAFRFNNGYALDCSDDTERSFVTYEFMTTALNDKAAMLQAEGCPFSLSKSPTFYLHEINSYLDSIGQDDGYWSENGKKLIPELFPESTMASKIQENLKTGYIARVHKDLLKTSLNDWDVFYMSRGRCSLELINSWVVFPVLDANEKTHWLLGGMLFPQYDGQTEGWIIYLPAAEIFA